MALFVNGVSAFAYKRHGAADRIGVVPAWSLTHVCTLYRHLVVP